MIILQCKVHKTSNYYTAVPGLDSTASEKVYNWQDYVKTLTFYSLLVT